MDRHGEAHSKEEESAPCTLQLQPRLCWSAERLTSSTPLLQNRSAAAAAVAAVAALASARAVIAFAGVMEADGAGSRGCPRCSATMNGSGAAFGSFSFCLRSPHNTEAVLQGLMETAEGGNAESGMGEATSDVKRCKQKIKVLSRRTGEAWNGSSRSRRKETLVLRHDIDRAAGICLAECFKKLQPGQEKLTLNDAKCLKDRAL